MVVVVLVAAHEESVDALEPGVDTVGHGFGEGFGNGNEEGQEDQACTENFQDVLAGIAAEGQQNHTVDEDEGRRGEVSRQDQDADDENGPEKGAERGPEFPRAFFAGELSGQEDEEHHRGQRRRLKGHVKDVNPARGIGTANRLALSNCEDEHPDRDPKQQNG